MVGVFRDVSLLGKCKFMTVRLTLLADFISAGFFPTGADSDG